MIIQYCSDLHLEFKENKEFMKRNPLQPTGEILVLAGDIMPFHIMDRHKDFFDYVSKHYAYTYWLPGNHEYYHGNAAVRSNAVQEKIRSNVFLVNNTTVLHKDVRLIFSTLWTHINPVHEWEIERSMNDFQVIRYKDYHFSATVYNELHEAALRFIKEHVNHPFAGKTIVATHHVPTFLNYPKQYKGSLLSEAFAVELYPFIESNNIDYWMYGHHHSNTPPFNIGKTTLLTNQLGYVQNGEHTTFDNDKTITI